MVKERPDLVKSEAEFDERVVKRCSEICRLMFESVKDKLDRKFGCFELFGYDFLLDDDLNPHLIEVNTNPALFTDTKFQKELLPKLVDDTVKLALELHPFDKSDSHEEVKAFLENQGVDRLQLPYQIIYKE